MQLHDFEVYEEGRRCVWTLTSPSATVFVADVTGRLTPDEVGTNGFGMEDAVAAFADAQLDVTLCFSADPESDWVEGVLVSTLNADLAADGWKPLPNWNGSPFRFCLDSGIAVLAIAEAFPDLLRVRGGAGAFDLAARIGQEDEPRCEPDRVYFKADVNCFECWALGDPGNHQAIYIDMAPG